MVDKQRVTKREIFRSINICAEYFTLIFGNAVNLCKLAATFTLSRQQLLFVLFHNRGRSMKPPQLTQDQGTSETEDDF